MFLIRFGLVVSRQLAGEHMCALPAAAKGGVHAAFVLSLCTVAWGWTCACAQDRLSEGQAVMMRCVRVTMKWKEPVCLEGACAPVCTGWRGGVWCLPVHTRVVSSSGQARCLVAGSLLGGAGSLCVCGCFSRQRESPWCRVCMVCASVHVHIVGMGCLRVLVVCCVYSTRGRGCCVCACQAAEYAR